MDIKILVKSSSSSEPRSVNVVQDDSGLSFFCDCPAGIRDRVCKHKRALASADDSMLFNEDQRENFDKLIDRLGQTGYPGLMQELKEVEGALEPAKEQLREIKEKVARAMKEGMK